MRVSIRRPGEILELSSLHNTISLTSSRILARRQSLVTTGTAIGLRVLIPANIDNRINSQRNILESYIRHKFTSLPDTGHFLNIFSVKYMLNAGSNTLMSYFLSFMAFHGEKKDPRRISSKVFFDMIISCRSFSQTADYNVYSQDLCIYTYRW
jgi:hypothetical protein